MNKIAAYELLLEEHPLWNKEAEKQDGLSNRQKAMLTAGTAAVGLGLAHKMRTSRKAHKKLVGRARKTMAKGDAAISESKKTRKQNRKSDAMMDSFMAAMRRQAR